LGVAYRHAPPKPASAVQRPELFDRLDAGRRGALTVITGPPGAGKTLLLGIWLNARPPPGPVAWLSLEPRDGRLERFWSEFLKVVRRALGQELEALPDPSDGIDDEFLAAVGRALEDLPEPLLVVLDDFEQLHSREVTDTLDRFLRRAPRDLHVVIASRLDPGLSLQRMRLEGQLSELRSTDLALSRAEAGELFDMQGLRLTVAQVDRLHRRTEGWAAGLRLAALSLSGHPDPESFVATFAGDERTVADYLVEEVLHGQPPEVCEFMLRTSVVEKLEPGLADALTGKENGARMLELLERSNAFLLPLDEHRRWYRYHPMFAELLRSQLKYRMPDVFVLGHRRAARWFAAHGMATAAVAHAVTAGDVGTTSDLLAEHWLSLVVAGETEMLAGWMDALPRHAVAGRAELALAGAGAALDLGALDRAESYTALADAKAGTVPAKRRARYSLSRTLVAMLEARLRGDFETTQSAARKVLVGHQLAGLPAASRAVAMLNLGVAECWLRSPRDGFDHLEQALELARREHCEYVVLGCLSQLALFRALSGALRDAARFAQGAIRTAVRHGWDEQAPAAPAHLALAVAHYHWADLDAAGEQLERSARATTRHSQERTTLCLIGLVRGLLLARSNVREAARVARTVMRDVSDWGLPESLAASAGFVEATMLAEAGEGEQARATLARCRAANGEPAEYAVVAARLALADGDPAEALRRLPQDLAGGDTWALHPSSVVEGLALSAVSKHLLHDDQSALCLLEQALMLAQPNGFRQSLLIVGPPLRDLLKRRIRAGTAQRTLAGELIGLLEEREGWQEPNTGRLLLDPLSDREEAVLRYLPTLMSKAEIASELFVSVNTVKTHTKNIYRKLGVGTRTDAVRRAKSMNLV
jgi:LuxR family maltose regulon positive regulatory protein